MSNDSCDLDVGAHLYNQYFDEMTYAEEIGKELESPLEVDPATVEPVQSALASAPAQ